MIAFIRPGCAVTLVIGVDATDASMRSPRSTYGVSVRCKRITYAVSMSRQTRTPLSKERVLLAAIAFADEHGVEALSMRRLAKELGVEAMSLYNHVANKDEILDGIIDAVVEEIELPPSGTEWKEALRQNAISTRDVLLRHRWASGLWMSRQGPGDARLRNSDWKLRMLREAGFSKELVYHAFHILDALVLGFMVQLINFPYKGEELASVVNEFLRQFPGDDYPDMLEHIKEHLDPPERSGYELALDLILDSLERLRDAG
jgi:AcrR family transcriptional regulator